MADRLTKHYKPVDGVITTPDKIEHAVRMYQHGDQYILPADQKDLGVTIEDSPLRAVHVRTGVSDVKGDKGELRYRGITIQELVENGSYEETAYLLLRGQLPNEVELTEFKGALADKAVLTRNQQEQLIGALMAVQVDGKTDAMSLLSLAVSVMNADEKLGMKGEKERYESALRTTAVLPTLIGLVSVRLQAGDQPEKLHDYKFFTISSLTDPRKDFSYAALLTAALTQKDIHELDPKKVRAMEQYLILHAEHGLNLSTTTARAVDSGESSTGAWRTTLGAMQALAGDRHGNASVDALMNLQRINERKEGEIADKVAGYVAEIDAAKKYKAEYGTLAPGMADKVPGFGHAIYTALDPRASTLCRVLETCGVNTPLLEVARTLQEVLEKHPSFGAKPHNPIYPNVDFYSGVLLTEYLEVDPRLMTSMFAVGRNVGWHAHAAEGARELGVIVRPEAIATTAERHYLPMEQRTPPTGISAAAAFPLRQDWKSLSLAA